MYTPTFAELVGDEEEFFSVYFNRMPLLRTGELVGDPRQVLSIADLDQLLHFEVIRPPYFGITSNGEKVTHAAYTSTTRVQGANVPDTVVPEKVYELFRTGGHDQVVFCQPLPLRYSCSDANADHEVRHPVRRHGLPDPRRPTRAQPTP